MADNRQDLKQKVKILVPDNQDRIVTPERVREALSLVIDACLNLVQEGTVAGGDNQSIQSDVDFLQKLFIQGTEVVLPTPTNGAVKITNIANGDVLIDGTDYFLTINNLATAVFSPESEFPKAVRDANPGQTPQTNPAAFIPALYNATLGSWRNNAEPNQATVWKIHIEYTRNNKNTNRELVATMRDVVTGESEQQGAILLSSLTFNSFSHTFYFVSQSNGTNTTDGLEIILRPDGVNLNIDNISVTRLSLESFK